MKVRFKYEKNDSVKYVGHLDVMAMFDRAFRRGYIQIQFSQGFTQRSQIIFALPSSVGVISKCEYFEVEIPSIQNEDIQGIVEKLNRNLPQGFKIVQAFAVEDSCSIMQKVESAEYKINIMIEPSNVEKVKNIFEQDKIFVKRIAKNGIQYDMNIKPYILKQDTKIEEETVVIFIQLKSGSKENLKPDYIIQALENYNIDIRDYQITKTNVLLNE